MTENKNATIGRARMLEVLSRLPADALADEEDSTVRVWLHMLQTQNAQTITTNLDFWLRICWLAGESPSEALGKR